MFTAIFGSVEQGIIYAIMALGVYITFRVLDFPDLTVDGSFVTGACGCSYNDILWLSSATCNRSSNCHWIHCGLSNGSYYIQKERLIHYLPEY